MTILMYHKVSLDSPTMWWVAVDEFYRQMLELRSRKVVYLDDYNPRHPDHVVITFDGVYQNVLYYAVPILRDFNYPFELFISSDYLGKNNYFDQPEPRAEFVNLDGLKLMVKMNGRLQWHTKSHPDLTNEKNISNLLFELEVPSHLKKIDGKGFKWFAYPYGKFNQIVVEEVKKIFVGAVSCHQGNDADVYCLNRITVTNETIFKKASIAVIIASYNYGPFLVEAVESVLRQTRMPDEILITDDASDDNTYEIAEFYRSKYPNLIKINRNEINLGIVKHFNKAVDLTRSEYISILGADNRYRSDFIDKTSLVLDKYLDVSIAYSDFALFGYRAKVVYDSFPLNRRGSVKTDRFFIINFPDFNEASKKELLTKSNFIHGSSMFRRQAFDEVGGYIEQATVPEDYNLFLRMIRMGWNARRVPFPILEYRQHSKEQANIRLISFAELQFYKELTKALHVELEQLQLQLQRIKTQGSQVQSYPNLQPKILVPKCIEYPAIATPSEGADRPFWSVMIPTYNGTKYLEKTLRSVLTQAPGPRIMQIEVIDDCSIQDDIEAIVREVGQDRVSFHQQSKNLGLIGNWNACIQRARGHWVHILHQDDLVMPGFYSCLQEALEKEPTVGAAFCRHSYIDEKGDCLFLSLLERETPGILSDWLELIAIMQRIQFPSIVVRHSTYEKLGGFCPQAGSAADWEMWKRIAVHYPVWYEPQILACYRMHSASESSRLIGTGTNIADTRRAIEISQSYLPDTIASELSSKAREYYALDALSRASKMLDHRDLAAAIAQIREGLKCSVSPRVISSLASLLTATESEPLLRSLASLLLSTDPDQFFTSMSDGNEPYPNVEFELRDINLIIFPDWKQPEELLYQDLASVIRSIVIHPDQNRMTLLIDNSDISDEDANLIISGVIINLLQQEDLDITEEPEISLVGKLSERQWEFLLQRIHARIVLTNENKPAITKVGAENIPSFELEGLEAQIGANSTVSLDTILDQIQSLPGQWHTGGALSAETSFSASATKAVKKKALVFFPHNPYPPRTGAHQRCLSMLSGLKELGYDVTLLGSTLITDNPWQVDSINDLQNDLGIKVDVYQGTQADQEFMARMSATSRELVNWDVYIPSGLRERFRQLFVQLAPDVVVINYALWGGLAIGEEFKSAVRVIETHDLITLNIQMRQALRSYLTTVPFTPDQIDPSLVEEDFFSKLQLDATPEEYWIYDQYDYTIAIAPREAQALTEHTHRTQVEYVPMTFTTEPLNNTYTSEPLFLVGPNPFNVQGYLYFTTKVLPVVLRQLPEFRLQVVGSSCQQLVPVDGVQLLGFVPDLKPLYSESRFAVCPLIGGTGQQVKIVEAMTHGVPVIALRNVAESSPIKHGINGFIADNAEEFAEYTIQLFHDQKLCRQLGQAALETIAENYSKHALVEKLNFLGPEKLQNQNRIIEKILPIIIVDGVFFQLYKTGIARVWRSLLEEWAANGFAKHIVVLDRAGTAPKIPGIRYCPVPPYDYGGTDGDREMLQQVCDEEDADLFISSYYTTPLSTPSVFMAHDMIPELMGWDLNHPMWREKHYGIQHATAYITVSANTARDLVRFFPHISLDSVTIAQNGVNHKTFSPASAEDINHFKTKYGISKSYFFVVGAGGGYKNTILFFKAFAQLYSRHGFDIVCTGSGSLLEAEFRNYTSGSVVHMLQLSDEELSAAYSGALALVYPSKYEGFGLPVLEALACGCPVITCPNASITEVAGKAALYMNDDDVDGLANALCDVQKPKVRNSLIAAGLEQAKKFSWSKMASTVSSALIDATLLPLNLKDINLIVFPDWFQPEESLCLELEQVIRAIATHPDSSQRTLLIDTSNTPEEEAALILSSVSMNLLLQEDLDVSEGPEISLIGKLGEIQWEALLPRIHARIVLENENQQAIAQVKAETIPSCKLDSFISQGFSIIQNALTR